MLPPDKCFDERLHEAELRSVEIEDIKFSLGHVPTKLTTHHIIVHN